MKKSTFTLAALAAGSLLSFSAHSAIISFTFEGTTAFDCVDCVPSGTNITAVYTIDTNNAFDAELGKLIYQTADITVGSDVFSFNANNRLDSIFNTGMEVYTLNVESVDTFIASNDFYGYMGFESLGPVTSNSFTWNSYTTNQAYTGDFSISGDFFGNAYIQSYAGANSFKANYEATSFSVSTSVVPVPAAVWLFGSGLIGLAGVARRKV